jgi:membrane-bound ClpP family serine protease
MWGSHIISLLCGIAMGFVAMYLVAIMLRALKKLETSGTINMKSAIGQIGEVYLTVPEMDKGRGKVNLVLGGQLQDYAAISRDSEPIAFGTKVRVVDIEDDDTLVVQRESEEIV